MRESLLDDAQRTVAVQDCSPRPAGSQTQWQHGAAASDPVPRHNTLVQPVFCAALVSEVQKAGWGQGGRITQPSDHHVPLAPTPEPAPPAPHDLGEQTASEDGSWGTASTAGDDGVAW